MSTKKEKTKSEVVSNKEKEPEPIIHTVVPGDTLRGISEKYLGTPRRSHEIRSKNKLATDILRVGRKLVIPNK